MALSFGDVEVASASDRSISACPSANGRHLQPADEAATMLRYELELLGGFLQSCIELAGFQTQHRHHH
jgi:hypothetical protein